MEKFVVKPTKTTFGIVFDPENKKFEFTGNSYPANAIDFFQPMIDWVNNFLVSGYTDEIVIDFKVNYFNTSSSKYIFKVLEQFDAYHTNGNGKVRLLWHYNEGDEDIMETWKEFIQELDIPYEIVLAD